MREIITTKHNILSKIKEIQEVENNGYQKKIATAFIMILCLVTFALPWKHCKMNYRFHQTFLVRMLIVHC